MGDDSQMNDWSYMPMGDAHSNNTPTGIINPQQHHTTPSHLKPPIEADDIPEEEKESPIYITGGGSFPCSLQRLPSPTEESYRPFSTSPSGGNTRDETPLGNSLTVQGITGTVPDDPAVQASANPELLSGNHPDQFSGAVPDQVPVVQSVRSLGDRSLVFNLDTTNNIATTIGDNSHPRDSILENIDTYSQVNNNNSIDPSSGSTSINSNRFKYVVEPNTSSAISSGGVTTQAVNATSTSPFPPEPTILANKYAVLGPVDASTCHGISLRNHDTVHIKAVSPRTARDVCAQQAMLVRNVGVRAPMEAVVSECRKRAWLVFPPHFGDLHSYVRLRRRLREAEAQRLFAQVATTVENCHSSGLVLRDLKLRKFVFTDSNRQQVVLESVEDSVVAGESDLLHDKHGCPAYVAPEILSSSAYSGRHADMWGLGVILYTMLVGRYPFHNADTSALFAKIRSGKFFIPDWVSSRARHLILSLLRRQPQRRLTAQQVLLHPWMNRVPRDHVGKDARDHIVPSQFSLPSVVSCGGKSSRMH